MTQIDILKILKGNIQRFNRVKAYDNFHILLVKYELKYLDKMPKFNR